MLARQGLGRTFQTPRIFPDMTVAEHVRPRDGAAAVQDGRRPSKMCPTRCWTSASTCYGAGGWTGRWSRSRGRLSHGQRRFLEIATAVARSPSGPATGRAGHRVSSEETGRLVVAVRRLAESGVGVGHRRTPLDVVTEIADRVVVLHLGRILWEGPPDELSPPRRCETPTRADGADDRYPAAEPAPDGRGVWGLLPGHSGRERRHLRHSRGGLRGDGGANGAGKTSTLHAIGGLVQGPPRHQDPAWAKSC